MPSYTAGTAFIRIAPSLRGLHAEINRELRSITPEPTIKVKIKPEWARGTRIGPLPGGEQEVRVPVRAQVDKKSFGESTVAVAALQRSILQIARPVAAAFAVPAVVGFASAVEAASRSILLVPGVVAAAGVATATYKVGVMGLADAFKAVKDGDPEKIAEAMAKLSPAARSLVTEVMRISPAFKSMQLGVQDRLLAGIGARFSDLAMRYLPVLRTGLGGTAVELNRFAVNTINVAKQIHQIGSVTTIFTNTRLAIFGLNEVGGNLLRIFLDIAAVGSDFLPGLAAGFGEASARAMEFVANARDTGQLHIWIESGINAVRDFITILVNVGATLNNVMDAAGMDNFLGKLVEITAKTREWSESAGGVATVRDLFSSLSDLGVTLAPKLAIIAGTIIKVVEAIGPAIKPLAQGVTDVTAAAAPAVELFTTLGVSVLPPLGAALSFLAPVLGPVVAGFIAASVATKLWAIAQGIGTAALVAYNFAIKIAQGFQLAYMIMTSAGTARLVAWAAAQWLVNAAMAANPLGIVVVAIAALVAIIVLAWTHSETFRNIVIASWEAIKAAAVGVWGWLTDTIFPSFMQAVTDVGNFFVTLYTGYIQPAWEGIKAAFVAGGAVLSSVWDAVVFAAKLAFVIIATIVLTPLMLLWNEVSGLFMYGYTNFIKPAWDAIVITLQVAWAIIEPIFMVFKDWVGTQLTTSTSAFGAVVDVVWKAIQATIGVVWEFIKTWVFIPIQLFVTTILTPMFQQFQADTNAAWEQIRAGIDIVWTFIRDNIWQPIVDFLVAILQPAFDAWAIVAVAAWETIRAGIDAAWVWIRDNIWNPIVEFITVTIPNGFQTGVDAIGRLWDGIKEKLRTPLQAAIDVVWNNGIVWVWNQVADLVGLGKKLSPYTLPGFAEGGPITGGVPNKDSVLLRAMPGEFIFSKAAVDSMGGPAVVDQIHKMFRGGGPVKTVSGGARGMPGEDLPRFAGGGVVPGAPAAAPVNPLAALGDIWGKLTGAISGLGRLASGAGQWGQAVVGFGTKIGTAVLENLQQKVAAWAAQFVGAVGPSGGHNAGRVLVGGGSGRGFIIAHESGGNPTARNPTSTASGLYQMINGTWKAYGGSTPTAAQASVAEQNAVADRYVASRYGSWAGAEAFWRSHHWYDQGGMANGRGFMGKATIKPERVLSNRQTRAFEALVAAQTRQGGFSGTRVQSDRGEVEGQSLGPGSFIGQLVVTPQPGDSIEHVLDTAMVRARHEFHSGRYGRR